MELRLEDGTELVVRPIVPGDAAMLASGADAASAETMLRYLTDVDFIDHHAVVAVHAGEPRRLAGVARWVRDADDPTAAEMAILIADELQGRGLGTALGRVLVEGAGAPRRGALHGDDARRERRRAAAVRAHLGRAAHRGRARHAGAGRRPRGLRHHPGAMASYTVTIR
ncbi:MAG: hypothetical protein ACXVFN_22105, partial [Solirubrobacteraceae bacterium]